jgi:ribosomal protein L17
MRAMQIRRTSSEPAASEHREIMAKKNISAAVNKIVNLLNNNKKKEGRKAIEKLVQMLRDNTASERRKSGEDEPITKSDLRNLLEIALRSRPQTTPSLSNLPNTQLGYGGSADT